MADNEYFRRRRAYLRQNHRCIRCGRKDARTELMGRAECADCREKQKIHVDAYNAKVRQRYKERKDAGLCPYCGGPRDRKTVACSACRELAREKAKQRG